MKMKVKREVTEEIDIPIKEITDYTDEEKIKAFDKLHKYAKEQLVYKLENDYEMKDATNYTWEEVMSLLGENIWDIWNNIDTLDR